MSRKKILKKEFRRLARKRVRQLKSNFRDIADTTDSRAVHDFRKATRRLQTIVDLFKVHRHAARANKIRRELQAFRHAAGEWRDTDAMLQELRRRRIRPASTRECWHSLENKVEKRRNRISRQFVRNKHPRRLKRLEKSAASFLKKEFKAKSMSADIADFIKREWEKWDRAVNDFAAQPTAPNLHAVRIRSKSLRYAIEMSFEFFPDPALQRARKWLKKIQARVGAWHDELMLGEHALAAFEKTPRDPGALQAIRLIKQREIAMAEAGRDLVLSIRRSPEYRATKRGLSASVFALSDVRDPTAAATSNLAGPIG